MVDTKNIKYHTITKHWGNPSFCQEFSVKLEKWLLQLNELEKPLMLNLLKHFYYYTEERLNSKAIKLYQKYKEEYSTDCDSSVYTKIEKETGVGFSSFIFETFWVKNGLKDSASDKFMNEVQTWDTLPEVLAIIDDYSGTGATFINYINNIRLSQNGFPIIYNLRHLRKILKIQKQDQDKFFGFGRNQYHKFYIPKKSGGKREIEAPSDKLKSYQSWIKERILDKIHISDQARGFRKACSILDNASYQAKLELEIVKLNQLLTVINSSLVSC